MGLTLVGLVVLGLLVVDAYLTVLDPSSGAGPYTSLQNRAIWRTARALGTRVPGGDRVLSLAAPTMALATPVAWVAMVTVGFAFVYRPVVASFTADPPLEAGAWLTALYYSGYITSTLGLGDVTPSGSVWRVVTVVHAAVGFGLFSAAITYILSIYDRHNRDAALALHVDNTFRESDLLDWGPAGSDRRVVARALAVELSRRLAGVNVAHRQYPILHYFHGRPDHAVVVQVGRVIEFLHRAPDEEERSAALPLRRGVQDFMGQMPFDTGAGEDNGLTERHRRLLRSHGYGGWTASGVPGGTPA